MTSTTQGAGAASDDKAKAKAKEKPIVLKNLKPAPFWYDDSATAAQDQRDRGIALKDAVTLTAKQWKRRSPKDWGVLIANEVVHLSNIPEEDVEAVSTSKEAEERRLANRQIFDSVEQAVLKSQHHIGGR